MPDSSSTMKPSGSREQATPIKQSATQTKDMTTVQEANNDTHMSDGEEEDAEEDSDTDDDGADVEEEEDEKEERESDEEEGKEGEQSDEEEGKEGEQSDEESEKDAENRGDKTGTTLPVRSHLPVKAYHSSPIKASRTSPIKAPRSTRPARSQSPLKAPQSSVKPSQLSAKVSDEAAEEANRPKSSTSDVRRQAQTPELKPKRSQKTPLQLSPSKPSRPQPSKTAQASPSKAGDIADFDWEEFEKRYDQALDEASQKETELLKEFDQLVQYFHVWAEASSSHDNERAVKRRVTRERRVNLSEEQLKLKKSHLTEVVTAFHSALALLNQPHMQM